jgi:DNA-3-methyladenine glycosylase II
MNLTLKPSPPFRLDLTVWVLRRVPINAMDHWDGRTYRRIILIDGTPASLEVVQIGPPEQPVLRVSAGSHASAKKRVAVIAFLDRLLGLHLDLAPFYRVALQDKRLDSVVRPYIGFRPPRLPSVFESLLNGVACQQLSLHVGIHLLNRLCASYGRNSGGDHHAFPLPEDLANAPPEDLKRLGFSGAKAKTILGASRAIASGELDLELLARLDDTSAFAQLQDLHGVGRWTAQYVLLRGLGRLDVFRETTWADKTSYSDGCDSKNAPTTTG